jgi:predicted nucleic acid-binding protein
MSVKFFLDTNVFIYSLEESTAAKTARARELIARALSTRQGLVSYQVVQEFFNVALRRFENPMQTGEAEQFLTTVFRPLLVVPFSLALCTDALRVFHRYRFPWYDSLIVAGALQAQCGILYTEDFQHGQKLENLEIRNPFL